MVPRLSISSSRSMPMPLSAIVSAGRLVGDDADDEPVVAGELGPRDRLVAELVAGIGGVGDQLAQEDLAVGVDRVHHQVEEARDLGLEGVHLGCGFGGCAHGPSLAVPSCRAAASGR